MTFENNILYLVASLHRTDNGPSRFNIEFQKFCDLEGERCSFWSFEEFVDSGSFLSRFMKKYVFTRMSLFSLLARNILFLYLTYSLSKKRGFCTVVFYNVVEATFSALFLNKRVKIIGFINDYENCSYGYSAKKIVTFRFWRHFFLRQFEKVAYKYSTLIIVNSNYLKTRLELEYGAKANVFLLHKGVYFPQNFIRTREIGECFKVLFVKTDYTRGGLVNLLIALNMLDSNLFEVYVVGPNINSLNKLILKYSSFNVKIIPCGYLKNADVLTLMNEINVFCTPSLSEAFGVANLEALVRGLPVVYSDVGGVREVFFGDFGLPCDPNNPSDIRDAFRKLLDGYDEGIRKIIENRELIRAKFDERIVFKRLLNELSTLIVKV